MPPAMGLEQHWVNHRRERKPLTVIRFPCKQGYESITKSLILLQCSGYHSPLASVLQELMASLTGTAKHRKNSNGVEGFSEKNGNSLKDTIQQASEPHTANLRPGFPVWIPEHSSPLLQLMVEPLHGFLRTSSVALRRHGEAGA